MRRPLYRSEGISRNGSEPRAARRYPQMQMPRVTLRSVQNSIEANKFPHHLDAAVFFEAPIRIRASLSKMIGAKPEEIAVTAGAGAGVATVAHFLTWEPGDEVITAKGE